MTMTEEPPTAALNKSLSEMRDKSKQLNDSLQSLAAQGFDGLAKAVSQAAASSRSPARRPAQDIVSQELARLLRQELSAGIAGMFGQKNAGGGISVVIHNNTPATVTASESIDAFDRKTLEITIDQMVANSLANGRETGGVLRALFGIVPNLLGR